MTSWNVEIHQTVGVHGNIPDAKRAVEIALGMFPSMTSRLEIIATPIYANGKADDDDDAS